MPTISTRSITVETKCFDTMRLFDYYLRDKYCLYITRAIILEHQLLLQVSKKFDGEEGLAKRPVVIGKDACQ